MTAAIVLAGGRSRRFGADKLASPLADGRSLLVHSLTAAAEVATDLVLVVEPGAARPADLPDRTILVHDPEAHGGPLVGLATGLGAVTDEIVLVVGGDMPVLVPAVLRLLVARLEADDAVEAARLELDASDVDPPAGDRARPPSGVAPLPCAVRRDPARRACRQALADGDRRLRGCLDRLATAVVPAVEWHAIDPAGGTLLDIDDPADLARLLAGE